MVDISTLVIYSLNGLYYAAILFFIILGLSLVFDTLNFVNLAHGMFFGFGAFLAVSFADFAVAQTGNPWTSLVGLLVAAPIAVGIITAVMDKTLFEPLYDLEKTYQVLATFAVLFMAYDAVVFVWTSNPYSTSQVQITRLMGTVEILGFTYPIYYLLAISVFVVAAAAAVYLLEDTKIGKISRAMSEDAEMVQILGINEKRVRLFIFTFAGIYAGIGGALLVPVASATPDLLVEYIILAFAGMVIGGVGSIRGAIVAALVIGLLRSFGVVYVPAFQLAIVFVLMTGVIMIKPEGLYGEPVSD
jgi:branched-chain amino acid transport system permease protein